MSRVALEEQVRDLVSSAKGRSKLSEEALEELVSTYTLSRARAHTHTNTNTQLQNTAVDVLERIGSTATPTLDPKLDGRWKLLFTSSPGRSFIRFETHPSIDHPVFFLVVSTQKFFAVVASPPTCAGTNSPIQRTFTGIDSISIYQEVRRKNEILRGRGVKPASSGCSPHTHRGLAR